MFSLHCIATRKAQTYREHCFYCCVFFGTSLLGRCLAVNVPVLLDAHWLKRVYWPFPSNALSKFVNMLSRDGVTVYRFWISDQIYWTLWYSAWLHFAVHCYTHTLVPTVMSSLSSLVVASNGGCSPSFGFPKYTRPHLPASNSNSPLWLNLNSSLRDWLTQSLTNSLH
jgi:hypothetical protein